MHFAKAAAQSTTSKAATLTIAAQWTKLLVLGGTIYLRRARSVLRATQKTSGAPLAKLAKDTSVTMVAAEGPWTQVKSGDATGWMRTSALGPKP